MPPKGMIEIGSTPAPTYDRLAQEVADRAAKAGARGHYLRAAKLAGEAAELWRRADVRRGGLRQVGAC